MSVLLPPAVESRAIIVGIERYSGLGPSFDAPGAVAGAIMFAHWLISDRRVPASGVDLWLSLRDGSCAREACVKAGLSGTEVHEFNWTEFREAMSEPHGAMTTGTFLIVYFCGHGVVSGALGEQCLVLPEATERQFRCFETNNWRRLFQASDWERFHHQLWIVDACRNQWGEAMKPWLDGWTPGVPNTVRQCTMFSCAIGEAAAIDSAEGPRFTRALLDTLAGSPAVQDEWPAFDEVLKATASRIRSDPMAGQTPALTVAEDWFGVPIVVSELAGKTLFALLSAIDWPYSRFRPYLMRALASSQFSLAMPPNLESAIDLLGEAADVDGVPPIMDFAERIARAVTSPLTSASLRSWIKPRLSLHQKAELDARLAVDVGRCRLSLWYRDDGLQPCIEGELDVLDAGGGVRAWPRVEAKPVTPDGLSATIGHWVQSVYEHVGIVAIELVVELYLPRELLTIEAYDTAIVPMNAGEELRLGEDHPVLLGCTDRYKGPTKLSRWRKHAARILARLDGRPANPMRWTAAGESTNLLRSVFVVDAVAAPVWLGFDPVQCGGHAPLDVALAEGLPAVVWLRAGSDGESIDALRVGLQELLKSSLVDLPSQLVHWRSSQAGSSGKSLSLLLDDPARLPAMWAAWTQPGE